MSLGEDIDQSRRRLAAMLLGTPLAPLAGVLHASPKADATPSAPADGGAYTGRWVPAFAA